MTATTKGASPRPGTGRLEGFAARIEPARLVWAVLAVALVLGTAILIHLTRGTTFWFDEWLWLVGRRGNDIGTFLRPYNDHLSLVPIALYRLLFSTAGTHSYVAYRLLITAAHLACVLLVFVYVRRRVGDYLALLAALLLMFFGPAWQDILWPFQIGWLISIAAGIGAFLMLDRHDRLGDLSACALLTISLASTSIGVAVALGALVEVAWVRRRAGIWIAAAPLVIYAIWSLAYQHASIVGHNVYVAERIVATSAATTMSALLGLSGQSVANPTGTSLVFGVPLALAALGALAWLAYRRIGWSARAVALVTVLVSFWILTAVGRAFAGDGYTNRYLYLDGVFVLLLAAELARGLRPTWRAGIVLGVITAAAVISNIGILRDGAAFLRNQGAATRGDLGAVELARANVAPGYRLVALPGYPLTVVSAGQYFGATRLDGTPADTLPALTTAGPTAWAAADSELIHADSVSLVAGAPGGAARPAPSGAQPPLLEQSAGGTVSTHGACLTFTASTLSTDGAAQQLTLSVPQAGVRVSASGAPASLAVRRFARTFQPVGTIRPGGSAVLQIKRDAAPAPWHLEVTTSGSASICGV